MVAVPSVRVGSPVAHDRLTVFPLFLEAPSAPGYRLSEEALADGTAVVEEGSEGGSVPNLAVDNRGTGRSDVPHGPYSLERMAADALAVLGAERIECLDHSGAWEQ